MQVATDSSTQIAAPEDETQPLYQPMALSPQPVQQTPASLAPVSPSSTPPDTASALPIAPPSGTTSALSGIYGSTPTASAQPAVPPQSTNDPMAFATSAPTTATDLPATQPPASPTPGTQPVGPTTTPPPNIPTIFDPAGPTYGQPTPVPTTAPSTPASSSLPSGFTLGGAASNNQGNAYYNGQQLNGLVADSSSPTGYSYSFANGSIVPGATQDAWQQIIGAENANTLSPQGQTYNMQQTANMPTTDPAIAALLNDPNYENAVANQQPDQYGNKPGAAQFYSSLPSSPQQAFQNTPLYGDEYSQLQAGGVPNLPTPQVFPGSGAGPVDALGNPIPSQQPQGSQASPSGANQNFTTYNPMTIAGAPGSAPASSTATPSSSGADTGTPSSPSPSQLNDILSNIGASPSTGGASGGSSGGPGYSLSPTDPNNPLTNQTITPTGTNFMPQAQQLIAAQQAAEQPQFQADLRDANRYAAGNGQLYSGIENSSLGNIVQNFALGQNAQAQQELYNALGQQNANNYANIGVEQQQQGFQNQQQNQAFNEALQQLLVGSQGDPAELELALSQIYGANGSQLGNAAQNYANTQTTQNYLNGLYPTS